MVVTATITTDAWTGTFPSHHLCRFAQHRTGVLVGQNQFLLLLICCWLIFNPTQSHIPVCYVIAFGGPMGMGDEDGLTQMWCWFRLMLCLGLCCQHAMVVSVWVNKKDSISITSLLILIMVRSLNGHLIAFC